MINATFVYQIRPFSLKTSSIICKFGCLVKCGIYLNKLKPVVNMSIQTIKSRRIALSISQIDMAKMIGITQSTYSRYENNHDKIPLKVMKKMAQVFQVPLNDLLYDGANNNSIQGMIGEEEILTKSYFDQRINELMVLIKRY